MTPAEISELILKIKNNDPTITRLHFSNTPLIDEDAIALAEALSDNKTILRLDLRNTRDSIYFNSG